MPITYNYNRQVVPPAPLVNVIVRSPEDSAVFVSAPALIDTGADYSVITREILEKLKPLRVGLVYVESFTGEGGAQLIYSVNMEIHEWMFSQVPVLVGAEHYVILGRDIVNNFDLRLNGIDEKFEFLRGPES